MKKIRRMLLYTLVLTLFLSTNAFAVAPPPDLIGTSAITIDLDTNEIIYTKDIDARTYPASITKLLTSLLLAENNSKSDFLTYTKNSYNQPAYSYRLNKHPVKVGNKMRADDVMDTLLLFSGNDIAYMIADNVGGNPDNFAKMMNETAKKIGMSNSHFITPNGLDDKTENHYTTAYDLTKLAKAAYENEWVKESMRKPENNVSFDNGLIAHIKNRNKLIGVDGCIGGKTGYTEKAGRCLTAIYERDGRRLIGVVMNSEYDYPEDTKVFEDMKKLIDWSYEVKKDIFMKKNTTVKTVSVPYKVIPFIGPEKTVEIPLEIREDITYYNNDVEPNKSIESTDVDVWSLNKETAVGNLTISQRDYSNNYKLYSTISRKDILKDNLLIYIGAGVVLLILIILFIILIASIKKRKRRRRRFY